MNEHPAPTASLKDLTPEMASYMQYIYSYLSGSQEVDRHELRHRPGQRGGMPGLGGGGS